MSGGSAALPATREHLLRPGQGPHARLDAAEDHQRRARPAGKRVRLDSAPGHGDRLRRHRGTCCQMRRRYHRLPMATITRADVEHVADLARLHLSDEELDRMQAQLTHILEAIDTLQSVDTSRVGPTASVIQLENVMRDDVVVPGIGREAALANAPLRDDPFLRVPTVLEEGR